MISFASCIGVSDKVVSDTSPIPISESYLALVKVPPTGGIRPEALSKPTTRRSTWLTQILIPSRCMTASGSGRTSQNERVGGAPLGRQRRWTEVACTHKLAENVNVLDVNSDGTLLDKATGRKMRRV